MRSTTPSSSSIEPLCVSTNVGIAAYPRQVEDAAELMRCAEAALDSARQQGRDTLLYYDPEMNSKVFERLTLEANLRLALEREELVVYYQPRVEISTGRLLSFEALVRWRHPEMGLVSPAQFIPLAEETGLIHEIGRWVLRAACAEAARWRKETGTSAYVAVNVSRAQLDDPNLAAYAARVLQETGLPNEAILIEITESALPANPERAVEALQRFRDLGLRLAIDDFGTGYSSLSYLASLPVDVVKMDKCFVDGLGESGRESDLAATILRIGGGLGLRTVAEGIERAEQVEQLRALGCDLGQGFHYARPLDSDAVVAFISADSPALLNV